MKASVLSAEDLFLLKAVSGGDFTPVVQAIFITSGCSRRLPISSS
jgi:hypothetical protein